MPGTARVPALYATAVVPRPRGARGAAQRRSRQDQAVSRRASSHAQRGAASGATCCAKGRAMRAVSAVLIHHPILDRERAIVTGAITNLDLHDISRSAHTYGLAAFYIAHPIAAQRELAARIREHWLTGSGSRRIPDRVPPMRGLHIVSSLDEALTA